MRIKLLFVLFLFSFSVKAQLVPVGQWRLHLPYREGVSVTEAGNKIYCASKSAIFYYDKVEHNVEKVTKISGLADIDIVNIKYNPVSRSIIVGYTNTNVDIIEGTTITNISDIKRKSILGNKVINSIYCNGRYAYLACGFGIVVVDMIKKEIKDTYYIGPNGDPLQVFDITSDGTYLYAATETGVMKAIKNSPGIANYLEWTTIAGLKKGNYNAITFYNNKLYASRSLKLEKDLNNADTVYVYNGTNWGYFDKTMSATIKNIDDYYNKLVITTGNSGLIYDSTGVLIKTVKEYTPFIQTQEVIIDKQNTCWVADGLSGLSSILLYDVERHNYRPNGPYTGVVYTMALQDNNLWVVPGGHTPQWGSVYIRPGVSSYIDGQWTTWNGFNSSLVQPIFDIVSVAIDPLDKTHLYVGSWGRGLVEYKNNVPTDTINDNTPNSLLQRLPDQPFYYWVGVGGLAFDKDHNLWMTNHGSPTPLVVKKADGTWNAFNLGETLKNLTAANILVDDNNQKWIMSPIGGGIVVFNHGASIDNASDDKFKKLEVKMDYKGASTNANVQCITKDLEGAIWIGTDIGVGVYYSPGSILNDNKQISPQQILVQQDGYNQYLLESEIVTAIAVDGANRKWIGTLKGGVFLVSADGTKQLEHFTEDNSPLMSNAVTSIVINNETGEVFFGSEKGIASYRGVATKAGDGFNNVYAFPNPIPSGYDGKICIKGLVEKANIKITDVKGNIVYETKSEGGQAVWEGRNLNGEKVETGVYLVFCTTTDGVSTEVSKLLFIK